MRHSSWWAVSWLISAVLLVVLVYMWVRMNNFPIEDVELTNAAETKHYLDQYWQKTPVMAELGVERVPTGIFIQSLKFANSSEVHVSGYVWQHYHTKEQSHIIPEPGESGFILPEQVDSGNFQQEERYRLVNGDRTTIGWYFEAALRQPFDYSKYPFDHKTVWVRFWPSQFLDHVLLVPDFGAYPTTSDHAIFGIEKDIVLGSWIREDTYFNYQPVKYTTNFGLRDHVAYQEIPELYYNFVIKRKFGNAFIVHLLPLFLVCALLFAALLTVSRRDEIASLLGFNVSGFIGTSSALFFVVLLSHIQLREQFAGSSIVYIEYFYILMYILLVMGTANTYLFTVQTKKLNWLIMFEDNAIPKVAFWPTVMACLVGITWFNL